MSPKKSHRPKKGRKKTPAKKKGFWKLNFTVARTTAEWRVLTNKIHLQIWEGYHNAVKAGGNLDFELWKRLPRSIPQLRFWAEVAACTPRTKLTSQDGRTIDEVYGKIRGLSLQKLACRLTESNPWQMSAQAWKISQEIQQLWPLWKAGLLREFGMEFDGKPTPKSIAEKLASISKNILRPASFSWLYVISRHEKRKSDELTGWHVHGYFWPKEGEQITSGNFRSRLVRLKRSFEPTGGLKYGLAKLWTRNVALKSLARSASYFAGNLDKTLKLRAADGLDTPDDAIKGVRFYAHSESRGHDCHGIPIPWESWRGLGRTTSFARAFRKAASKIKCEGDSMTRSERWEAYSYAAEFIDECPRIPTVRGEDGFLYEVIPGNALWYETQFFYLVRLEEREDYRLIGKRVPMQKRKPHFEKIMIPISLHELHKLGQAEVSHYTQKADFRPVCPITGRSPTPMVDLLNLPNAVLTGKYRDSVREEVWIRKISNRMEKVRMLRAA